MIEPLRHGIKIGLSSNSEISYGYDLLTIQHGLCFPAERAAEENAPARFTPTDVLRAATLVARDAGLLDSVGSNTPGKKADLVRKWAGRLVGVDHDVLVHRRQLQPRAAMGRARRVPGMRPSRARPARKRLKADDRVSDILNCVR